MKPEDVQFSKEELARYNRHIIIPGFGLESQKKLKAASVLVVGSGGLGSPALLYLAAAGVGKIGIVDYDIVEDNNLHRQVLFGIEEIGLPKAEMARRRLLSLNPHLKIEVFNTQLTSKNALSILEGYDLVADGTDNFPTRYLINDACVMLGIPNVYASISQFEGQVTVLNFKRSDGTVGPNYRDLFATPPPPGLVPSCAEGGVIGVLPGIIGSMQALEVIKVITGIGEILDGRIFVFDALTFESRMLNFRPDPSNPLTGIDPTIHALVDYEQFCGVKAVERKVRTITAKELYDWQVRGEDFQFIDVREPAEYEAANLGAELIPLGTLEGQVHRISRTKKVVVHCRSGARSAKAIRDLEDHHGFQNLFNLKGGILACQDEVKADVHAK